jgi:adenylate cyclase
MGFLYPDHLPKYVIGMLATTVHAADADAGEIIEWLAGDECHDLDGHGFIEAFGQTLISHGLPLDRLTLHIRALHPMLAMRSLVWERGRSATLVDVKYDAAGSLWLPGGPLDHVASTHECLVLRADDPYCRSSEDLFKAGLAEFYIAPMIHGTDAPAVNIAVFGTKRARGFAAADLMLFAASCRRCGARSRSRSGVGE